MATLQTRLSDLITSIGTDWKNIWAKLGSGSLDTTATNVTDAINEVNAAVGAATIPDATDTVKGKVELATTAEAQTGTDTVRAITAAGLKAAIDDAKAAILNGAPGALDTLDELAAALGDDANFASSVTSALAGKQPIDSDLTAVAALSTTSYGRAFLELANQAALMALLSSSSETVQGIIEIATTAETTTGSDDARAVTPLKLRQNIGDPDTNLVTLYTTAKA